ncbi:hypothetical protein JCM3765_001813 [Sporobolomyces pararoseus]
MESHVEPLSEDTANTTNVSYGSNTPSPPILAIRLVSPPTPTSPSPNSCKPSTLTELSHPTSETYNKFDLLSSSTRGPQKTLDNLSSPSFGVDHSTDQTSSLPRSATPTTFSFSTLFSSTNSRSLSTSFPTQQQSAPFAQPPNVLASKTKQPYKIRSPSLGQSKRTNVGMVKQAALGLARKVSRTVKSRISLSIVDEKNERFTFKTQKRRLRKIDEGEFPNVGALSEARKMRSQGLEERKKRTRRRSSNGVRQEREALLKVRSRQSFGSGTRRQSSPRLPTLPISSKNQVSARKVKVKPRVSFPRSSPTSLRLASAKKTVMNRPRPVPRRKNGSRTPLWEDSEEEEWLDEAREESIIQSRPSSRLSITSVVQRLPFLRSYAPPTSTLTRSTNSSSSSSEPPFHLSVTFSPPRSLDPSNESFHCRGEVPYTPYSDQHLSPAPQARLLQGRGSSPRNAVYIPRPPSIFSEGKSPSPIGALSSVQRRLLKERRREASISPGDLTRFLDELVFEQEAIESANRRRRGPGEADEEDIFADAEEPKEAQSSKRMEEEEESEYEFEISRATTNRSTMSSRTFVLSLPPPRRHSRPSISQAPTTSSGSPPSPLPSASPSRLGEVSLEVHEEDGNATSEEEDEPIQVLSASRETFVRGQLVRKGSLTSLGLRSSFSPSPSPSPTSPVSTSTISAENSDSNRSTLTNESIFARLQAQGPFDSSPRLGRSIPSSSHQRCRLTVATAGKALSETPHPPHTAPLPFSRSLVSPSISAAEHFVTAPSTPYGAASSPPTPLSSTSSEFSATSSTKNRNDARSPLSSLFPSTSLHSQPEKFHPDIVDRLGRRDRSESRKRRRETMLPLDIYQDLEESSHNSAHQGTESMR